MRDVLGTAPSLQHSRVVVEAARCQDDALGSIDTEVAVGVLRDAPSNTAFAAANKLHRRRVVAQISVRTLAERVCQVLHDVNAHAARVLRGRFAPLRAAEGNLSLRHVEVVRVRRSRLEERLDPAFALVELLLQPVGRLGRTLAPQLNGIDRHTVVGSMAHAVHHFRLVDDVARLVHLLAARNAHALKDATAHVHLLDAHDLCRAVVRRRKSSHRACQAAADNEDVRLFGAHDFRLGNVAQLESDRTLANDVAFDIEHRDAARLDRESISVDGFAEVATATTRLVGKAAFRSGGRAARKAESPCSGRSAKQAHARRAHEPTAAQRSLRLLSHFSSLELSPLDGTAVLPCLFRTLYGITQRMLDIFAATFKNV